MSQGHAHAVVEALRRQFPDADRARTLTALRALELSPGERRALELRLDAPRASARRRADGGAEDGEHA